MGFFFGFMVAAGGAALNVGLYADSHKPISLGAAVFCGALAVFNLVMAAR